MSTESIKLNLPVTSR